MRGIVSAAGYVPFRRLQRSEIAKTFGSGGGKGTRSVASYDEDTTTMGVEAARLALRGAPDASVDALWFATADPAYLDKTNATAIHAALRLDGDRPALDLGGALRSGVGTLRVALDGAGSTLVVSADVRTGLPTSGDEAAGGDGAAAVLVGDDTTGPVVAEYLAAGSATDEFLDRWRTPGERRSKVWEERFGETKYVPLGEQAWQAALKAAELTPGEVDHLVVAGMHGRAVKALVKRLGTKDGALGDDLTATVGNPGTAQAALLLTAALEAAGPGEVIALVALADGADVLLFRTTDALGARSAARPVAEQVGAATDVPYGKFLTWRGMVTVEPPRRPEPARVSASAAGRSEDWKFAFVGSRDRSTGALHLPPSRVSMSGGALDDMEPAPMADVPGTIVTFTIDKLAYSPSPPIVFAVVDFDGGGRFPVELTDVDAADVQIGDRVEMTFRRLFTADGIHDYFWKARPLRTAAASRGGGAGAPEQPGPSGSAPKPTREGGER
ncbi:MAG: hydroxymethylglutaryl-CoA synthase [Actinobacteria bacterium]|nr:hydroxymethylglutaryl-CoA synthase [Actinomycetota bacterium]